MTHAELQVLEELEELEVTAQKRPEPAQNVPIAITTLTSTDLDTGQFFNLQDIRNIVPNFSAEEVLSSTSTASFYLRGHGTTNDVFSFDAPISVYVDDVYFARTKGALIDLLDVERIEVLRGPQGTLFGRNASAGAIRVISKSAPLEDFDLEAEARIGTKDKLEGRLSVGVPLREDKLGVRLSLLGKERDGYQVNLTDARRAQAENLTQGKATLLWIPSSDVRITLRGDAMSDRSDARVGSNFLNNPDDDFFTYESNLANNHGLDTWGTSVRADWSTDQFRLTSLSAYRDLRFLQTDYDFDGSTASTFELDTEKLNQWQFTQEVFVIGHTLLDMPLEWTAGVFYLHEINDFVFDINILEFLIGDGPASLFEQESDSFAPYVQTTYPLTEKLNITSGIRWTYEKKDFKARQRLADGTLNPDFQFADDFTSKKWIWRASADYKATSDLLLYASAATGYRSGGFNGLAQNVEEVTDAAFGTEDVIAYEGGVKSEWLNRTLRLNVNYYLADYENLQLTCSDNAGAILAANANQRNYGVEAETVWIPVRGLKLSGTFGTTETKVSEINPRCADTSGTTNSGYRNDDYQWRVGAVYATPFSVNGGTVRVGADYSFMNDQTADTAPHPQLSTPNVALVNAHVAYVAPNDRWQLTLSGSNLTDESYPIGGFNIADGFISSVRFTNTPRNWALSFKYRL